MNAHSDKTGNAQPTEKRPDYYEQPRSEMLPFLPVQCRRVLEVGCGSGVFGETVRTKLGAEVWGVEPESAVAALAERRLDRVVNSKFPDDAVLPEKYFDCVVFNDVLEHMAMPEAALTRAKQVLAPGGSVLASIPNVCHFPTLWRLVVAGEWEYTERGILDKTHLRFFTRSSITGFFAGNGFRLDALEGIDPFCVMTPADHEPWRYYRWLRLVPSAKVRDMRFLRFAVRAVAI